MRALSVAPTNLGLKSLDQAMQASTAVKHPGGHQLIDRSQIRRRRHPPEVEELPLRRSGLGARPLSSP
jgi:hypothetical protein